MPKFFKSLVRCDFTVSITHTPSAFGISPSERGRCLSYVAAFAKLYEFRLIRGILPLAEGEMPKAEGV